MGTINQIISFVLVLPILWFVVVLALTSQVVEHFVPCCIKHTDKNMVIGKRLISGICLKVY